MAMTEPGQMSKHDELDEYLEALYHLRERHQTDLPSLREHKAGLQEQVIEELVSQNLVSRQGEQLDLTEEGFARAEKVIRRHRLAERLLTDVLHMTPAEVEAGACEFEHMVAEEITESICILLGHPRTCPHGSPIPQGPCCRDQAQQCLSAAIPITELPVGVWARVAYINSTSDERQHRLEGFGLVPGTPIKLHQLKPAIVVSMEDSRLAMEERVARDIYVWRSWKETCAPETKTASQSRFRFWRR
jgi:DtxR family transcriptional regulator, Mn-dependent transcriptional regulator